MKKPIYDFVQTAISSLSKENFDSLVSIFQKEYWKATNVVNVDGSGDGGCDIKVFSNKRELKKCIQVTVQKFVDTKIKSDLKKVDEKITKYGYSDKFEFYYSHSLSDDKIEEYKKIARETYAIDLELYDAKRLSQIDCHAVREFIYNLHGEEIKPEILKIDATTKILYDLLSIGNDTSEIKNSLYYSIIVFLIYERQPINIDVLRGLLEAKLNKKIPSIINDINYLKSKQRIKSELLDKQSILLTDSEYEVIKETLNQANNIEKDFNIRFCQILNKYGIDSHEVLMSKLIALYKSHYELDLDEANEALNSYDNRGLNIFKDFEQFIEIKVRNKEKAFCLISELKELCLSNGYLNRISAGASFLSLYNSNKLEAYINRKKKVVFLDTPIFIYFICSQYPVKIDEEDWDDPFYKSTKSLMGLQNKSRVDIKFCVMLDYLGEVAGELQKALRIGWFQQFSYMNQMGETRNTFYNYYNFLRKNSLFTEDVNIEDFEDFIEDMGFENIDPDDSDFVKDTVLYLREFAEHYGIDIIGEYNYEEYNTAKTIYEKTLITSNKPKSKNAVKCDLKQILYLLDKNNFIDYEIGGQIDSFFATWDSSFYNIRKILLEKFKEKYSYFYIHNPAKLVNKISLENFKIDSTCITNDIFIYADQNYNISSKVKSLIEIIAPIVGKKNNKNTRLVKELYKIRKQQIEEVNQMSDFNFNSKQQNLPIEEVLLNISEYIQSEKSKYSIQDFGAFLADENNNKFIIATINKAMETIKSKIQFNYIEQFTAALDKRIKSDI